MTAEAIAKALGGRKAGGGWTARCPAHDDRTPSLSIRDADDNKVLVHCHAGLRPGARHRGAASARPVDGEGRRSTVAHGAPHAVSSASRIEDDAKRSEPRSPSGNPPSRHRERSVETYLASRGIRAAAPTRCASMPV